MDPDIEPDIDKIDSGLFIGSLTAASNVSTLKAHGITHVLTVDTEPLPDHIKEKSQCRTLYVQADDRPHVDLLSHFDEAIEFIKDGMKTGAVLIHCFFGVSRSATLAIAHIMKQTNLSVQEAVARVKEKRPVISPNPGFMAQLHLYWKMNCRLDLNNPEYKLYRLEHFTVTLKKGGNFSLVTGVIAEDPGIKETYNSNIDVVYKCKSCRRILLTSGNVLSHCIGQKPTWMDTTWQVGEETEEGQCSQGLFVEPLEWMTDTKCSFQGKLLCPKCSSKVGNFNWIGSMCPCGVKVVPGFHIVPNRVDECKLQSADANVAS
ncbi:phosphatase [Chamberlinius hualienensis]